jgi:uncharacterized protein GlcG (DUF336 family)
MSMLLRTKSLTLEIAQDIASKAIQVAKENRFAPVGVTVLDACGHTVVQYRMDKCPPGFLAMAHAKANTCIQVGMCSRTYGMKYLSKDATPDAFVRLINQTMLLGGDVACFQGGVILREKEGSSIVGAVGVSGAAGDEDEYCALMGVLESSAASELVTEPAEHSCKTTIV